MPNSILHSYRWQNRRFSVRERTIEDGRLILTLEPRWHSACCPDCRVASTSQYDTRPSASLIRYEVWYEHPIMVRLYKRRFRCRNKQCETKVFTETISELAGRYQRHSPRFEDQCLIKLANHPFLEVQQTMGVSFSVVARILDRRVPETTRNGIDWQREFEETEEVTVGIDEHGAGKRRLAITITNMSRGTLLGILPTYNQQALEQFVRAIPSQQRTKIRYVAMDLTNRYQGALLPWLPRAEIAVDHFHLVRLANHLLWQEKRVLEGLERERPIKYFKLLLKGQERLKPKEQEKVRSVLSVKAYRRLAQAYELKEELRSVWRAGLDPRVAEQRFLQILRRENRFVFSQDERRVPSRYYRTFIETLQRFAEQILTFIRSRVTNAFTEGVHTKIKLLKRLSYGIRNVRRYIKRMILAFHPLQFCHHI